MKPKPLFQSLLSAAALAVGIAHGFAADTLTIDTTKPAGQVSPILYGLMTEEINYCYDGGLYAELVRNRAFQDNDQTPDHWSLIQKRNAQASISLDPSTPFNHGLKTSLKLEVNKASRFSPAGIANEGYWGIPVKPDTTYQATVQVKATADFDGPLTIAIVSTDGKKTYAQTKVNHIGTDWAGHTVSLKTSKGISPTTDARLVISVQDEGTLWFGLVSLFPPTWNDRPNGLRTDLMQMLVDLKPKFLRFPGGNYLEGDTVDLRFKWWQMLGPITERPGHPCPWGYRSSDGMGLLEFLTWCEDMGAEPVLGLYAGYSLKGDHIEPGPALEPFIKEALDEIEYVSGPVTSPWGARRAQDGHPEPFPLRYVEIGNEDWFDRSGSYDGRFAQFYDAIKAKYPELKCISSIGTEQPHDKLVNSRKPDVLDEHYYRNTGEFLKDSPNHFDNYDRNGPEIFVGEWAAHETPFRPWDKQSRNEPPTPNMTAAIGDGAFMAAMERNSDIVTMQAYAPLFVNVNEYQWRPDLIGYNALTSFGAPSYYALRMFSTNVGNEILKARVNEESKLQYSVTRDTNQGLIYIKLINPENAPQDLKINLDGTAKVAPVAMVETLSAAPDATNSINDPEKVVPVTTSYEKASDNFSYQIAPYSITVLKLKTK